MSEYTGKSARKYTQAESKLIRLFPALDKKIPKIKSGLFLDVGCGIGDYCKHVVNKGYKYHGIDVSEDMIKRAKASYPDLDFIVADSRSFSQHFDIKFDVILISMVLLTMDKKEDIVNTLSECNKVLKRNGILVVGDTHPLYDPYMEKYLFGRDDIEVKFEGYFKSGKLFIAHKKLSTGKFDFYDYHWTLQDYLDSFKKAGLMIDEIDECESNTKNRKIDPKYYDRTKFYPSFIVYVCKKR